MTTGTEKEYPAPRHISYDEDSRWCQEHGHTGLHNPDGSRKGGKS